MKLVINIPKRVYEHILKKCCIAAYDRLEVAGCIMDGTKIEDKKNESNSYNTRR